MYFSLRRRSRSPIPPPISCHRDCVGGENREFSSFPPRSSLARSLYDLLLRRFFVHESEIKSFIHRIGKSRQA